MKTNLIPLFILLTVGFLLAGNIFADEVRLTNGDKLTGQVVTMEEEKLVLKTTYAGEITITWKEVAGIMADDPVKVVLNDETALEGKTAPIEDGKMKLDTGKLESPASFSLADVKAINPKPVKPVKIATRVNASMVNQRGNTIKDNYYFDGEFVARTKKNRNTLGGVSKKAYV